jgi:outer membrane protein assembly factor BamB
MKVSKLMIAIGYGVLTTMTVTAGDWAVWRGPKSDGISAEKTWNPLAVKNLKTKWEAQVGAGYSSVAVSGGNVYTMGNTGKSDVIYCLDEKAGKKVWNFDYPCKQGRFKGPRATPVVVDGKVYTLSREGDAYCLDAKSGKEVWKNNLLGLGAKNIKWGLSSAPLVTDGMVIYNAGANGIALNAKTGKKVWTSSGQGGYAVPTIGPKGNLLIFGCKAINAVKPKTGAVVWSFPWETSYNVNAADPVLIGNKLFIASGYNRGCCMLDLSSGNPRKLWENKAICAHFSTPVYLNSYIFGVSGNTGKGSLVCLDPKSGKTKWSQKTGFGSLMAADGKLIVLTERGTLMVVKASTSSYQSIAETATKLKKTCWTHPVLCNGVIYCRNDKGLLLAVDVSK